MIQLPSATTTETETTTEKRTPPTMLLSQFNRDLVHRRCIVKIGDEARVEKILGQNGLRKLRENLFVSLVNNSPAAACSPKAETPPEEFPLSGCDRLHWPSASCLRGR